MKKLIKYLMYGAYFIGALIAFVGVLLLVTYIAINVK
jgi:hypothetical protein